MASPQRIALGLEYRGTAYEGWQKQPHGRTVQNQLEAAVVRFTQLETPPQMLCAGRTDTGVHARVQVVHFDSPVERREFSWVRGLNHFLPADVRVRWARLVSPAFHARNGAERRRYRYYLQSSTVGPGVQLGLLSWTISALDAAPMQAAVQHWLGEHDFSSFRAAQCQALSPVKHLYRFDIERRGDLWCFTIEGNAFLHHMVRNLVGTLLYVGSGRREPAWAGEVLRARSRSVAAPTLAAAGLYLDGVRYPAEFELDRQTWMRPEAFLF